MNRYNAYGIIILAAGNSSRLGEPKQLLRYQHKTLIRHITEAALATDVSDVVVVTGSNAPLIESELFGLSHHLAHNGGWQQGMGSSIQTGLSKLKSLHPALDGAIIAVSDQPFVTAPLFQSLIEQINASKTGIAASSYADTLGTPVLFNKKYFNALLQLSGNEGAKKLLLKYSQDVTSVPFPLGNIDIDTKEDYKNFLLNQLPSA
ncbi:nucleotidyltransferase family protein [Dyadobacter arcticus]|uniref:Molybdenum cofactor cytidylyltransferase n=1 Tax=Dyadobacter arcticus TaxID=1078754 RepID=A0ABX0UGK8_9BACT|nr:nucleotidyltransferase family protein [Dyadobacter arcticus]NIJ52142.1 molybdenum cofactor cytidylyltransferase [Dyadobacter arcticus]